MTPERVTRTSAHLPYQRLPLCSLANTPERVTRTSAHLPYQRLPLCSLANTPERVTRTPANSLTKVCLLQLARSHDWVFGARFVEELTGNVGLTYKL